MRKSLFNWIVMALFTTILLGIHRPAHAFLEINGLYFSDTMDLTTEGTYTTMLIDGAVGYPIDRQKKYIIAWNYTLHTITSESDGYEVSYSSTQMGPRFLWNMGRAQNWVLGLTYNLQTQATHEEGGGTALTLRGTAIKGDLTYNLHLNEVSRLGLRLNYSSVSYTESLEGTDDYEVITQSRSLIYPSLSYMIVF